MEMYDNSLGNQVRTLPVFCPEQLDRVFEETQLNRITGFVCPNRLNRIILTGCGDSFAAAGAAKHFLSRLSGVERVEVMDPMEYTRYFLAQECTEPDRLLVIGISAGGSSARVEEAMLKTNALGAKSVLVTNKPESRCAKAAGEILFTDTPKMKNDFPGLRSYFAAIAGLCALAAAIGTANGTLRDHAGDLIRQALCAYADSWGPFLEETDRRMLELAGQLPAFESVDCLGSGSQLYSALFAMQKFYECVGATGVFDDPEDWCHVNYLLKDCTDIPVILFSSAEPTDRRYIRTAEAALALGRPCLLITDEPSGITNDHLCEVVLPAPPEHFDWLRIFIEYAPAALLAGYCATVRNHAFFNEFDPKTSEQIGDGSFFNKDLMTTGSSEVVIVK